MKPLYRFGLYEANPATRELLREGVRIRLQEQPFRLLLLLLENHTELVSRERLRQELWSEDTFVEFENSLRVAIGKIREALKDDAENPRFVATVPRIGYRFLAPVTVVEHSPTHTIAVDQGRGLEENEASKLKPALRPKRLLIYAFAVLLVGGIIAGFRFWPVAPVLANSDTILLAGFENRTANPAFDNSLYEALLVKVNESPFLSLVPESKVRAEMTKSGKADEAVIWLINSRQACLDLGAKAFVQGVIESSSNKYDLRLDATRCADGKKMAREVVSASTAEEVLPALGRAADSLRRKLGESAESVGHFSTPIEQATTDSLSALKAFSLGENGRARGRDLETIPNYQLATDLDPRFALAYGRIGTIYVSAQEFTLARQFLQKAFDIRDRATERERLYLTSKYYTFVLGERERSRFISSGGKFIRMTLWPLITLPIP
jgi:eukaryotic-like serine/threonine-protein kinase